MQPINLKYPVILAHGIAAKDHSLFWGRIVDCLKEHGVAVFLGNTDSWGSIKNNAFLLKKSVDKVLRETHAGKVHIIAHSKGGIDSRYLISSLKYGDKIASLTTISTPHRGSEIANFVFERQFMRRIISRKLVRRLFRLYGDRVPQPLTMVNNLTTTFMEQFNKENPNDERVYYSSYHSIMNNRWDDLFYFYTYHYLRKVAGDNDGLVSVESARWGEEFHLLRGISHSEILDIKKRAISGINIIEQYLDIVRALSAKQL